MNYFAHALPFLDNPYFVVGTSVPDMLAVVDRRARVRRKRLFSLQGDHDAKTAAIAAGILQHLRDDAHFHQTRSCAELSLQFTVAIRQVLNEETGMRPNFLGHLMVELLLDATLCMENPNSLERYYQIMRSVDPQVIENVVNRAVAKPTNRLAQMLLLTRQERFLYDYPDDEKLVRLNQIMRRVGLETLPESICDVLPEFRTAVCCRKEELIDGIPA